MRAGALGGGGGVGPWWDKVPSKFEGWDAPQFEAAGFRAVPGAIVRRGAYIAPGVVLMPSFVNIGAYVDEGTMVDTWTTVGSCAQIGKNVHLSGGVGIGGVLEPLQANPTIIEDDCFIGARSEIAEGVIVREGAVISMGVFINASTPIVDRKTGEIHPRRGAALFGGHGRQPARPARHRALDQLRGDHEDGRRPDPLEDLDQRTAAGLSALTRSGAVVDAALFGLGQREAPAARSAAAGVGLERRLAAQLAREGGHQRAADADAELGGLAAAAGVGDGQLGRRRRGPGR